MSDDVRLALLVLAMVLATGCTLPFGRVPEPRYYAEVLGGGAWTDLVVEVDYAPGHAPSEEATTHLLMTLRNVTGKSNVVLDVRESLNDTPSQDWTRDSLLALERGTRRHEHAAPHALLHVLYVSGRYNGSDQIAGVTIAGRQLGPVAIFRDVLRDSSCVPSVGGAPRIGLPLPQPDQSLAALERSTLLHEAGHAMGLVDNGLPMVKDHEDRANDPAKGGHSTNPKSVMYWSLDTCQGLREALLHDGAIPDQFDGDDRADMRAVGGR